MKILAIGAHFDDVELGCGGTLINHLKKGDDITILVVTQSGYVSKTTSHIRDNQIAYTEGKKSASLLHADLITGNFETLNLSASKELINYLCEQIKKINPQIVYTHYVGDQHLDHQAVAKASIIATRHVKKVLSYVSNIYDTYPTFSPNYIVNISDAFENKLKLIDCFESEKETHRGWKRQLEVLNGMYGIKIGKTFAEPFQVIRIVEED